MNNKEDEFFKMLKDVIKSDIEKYPLYYINDEGEVIHDCNPKNSKTVKQADELYILFKDYYVKAVTDLNYIYSNMMTSNTLQTYMNEYADFEFNIMLSMIDTYFIYQKLKDNEMLLSKKKKTKLKCDKIKPISDYTKKASYVELALKNYKKLDNETKIEVIDVMYNTITDVNTINKVEDYNELYLNEFQKVNNIDNREIAKELIKISKDEKYKDKFNHKFI